MSKTATQTRRRKSTRRPEEKRRTPDRTIYAGLILIGVFIVLLAVPLTQGDHWQEVAVGYIAAMAWLINLYAFRAWRGQHLANWQAALARVPMRFCGYGTKGGKPLEACVRHDDARNTLIISVVVSLVVVVATAVLLVPGLRPW